MRGPVKLRDLIFFKCCRASLGAAVVSFILLGLRRVRYKWFSEEILVLTRLLGTVLISRIVGLEMYEVALTPLTIYHGF